MTQHEKTKALLNEFGVKTTEYEREGYDEYPGVLFCIEVINDGQCPLVGGYNGFVATFMFTEAGEFFQIAAWR